MPRVTGRRVLIGRRSLTSEDGVCPCLVVLCVCYFGSDPFWGSGGEFPLCGIDCGAFFGVVDSSAGLAVELETYLDGWGCFDGEGVFFDTEVVDCRAAGGVAAALCDGVHDVGLVEGGGFDHGPALVDLFAAVDVVGGHAGEVDALVEGLVPVDVAEAFCPADVADGVEDFDADIAGDLGHFFECVGGPVWMGVDDFSADGEDFVDELLGGEFSVEFEGVGQVEADEVMGGCSGAGLGVGFHAADCEELIVGEGGEVVGFPVVCNCHDGVAEVAVLGESRLDVDVAVGGCCVDMEGGLVPLAGLLEWVDGGGVVLVLRLGPRGGGGGQYGGLGSEDAGCFQE